MPENKTEEQSASAGKLNLEVALPALGGNSQLATVLPDSDQPVNTENQSEPNNIVDQILTSVLPNQQQPVDLNSNPDFDAANAQAGNFEVPAQQGQTNVPAPATKQAQAPTSSVKSSPTNYLKAFKKSVGDKSDNNKTTVGMDFGRYLGELRGSNKSSSAIGREMVNGRHATSQSILKAYAVQGQRPPANVVKLLDELDNLAAHSNTVASMDDKVRIQMIGQGHRSLDARVIQAQEDAIMKQVNSATGDLQFADERLDFLKKQADTSKAQTSAAEALYDFQNKQITDTYANAIAEFSDDELASLVQNNTSDIPTGYLLTQYSKRVEAKNKVIEGLAKVSKANVELRAASLSVVPINTLRAMEATAQASLSPENLIPRVGLPGSEEMFSIPEIQQAINTLEKLPTNVSRAQAASMQGNHNQVVSLMQSMDEMVNRVGGTTNSLEYKQLGNTLEQAFNSADPDTKQVLTDKAFKQATVLKETILDTANSPEERKALNEYMSTNRITQIETAVNSLEQKAPEDIISDVADNETYASLADVLLQSAAIKASEVSDGTSIAESLTGVKKEKDKRSPLRKALDDEDLRVVASQLMSEELKEELFTNKLRLAFRTLADETFNDEGWARNNPEQAIQIASVIDKAEETFFNNDPQAVRFSNASNPMLVTEVPITTTSLDENGNQVAGTLKRADGSAILARRTNLNFIKELVTVVENDIRDIGHDFDLDREFMYGNDLEAIKATTGNNTPKNVTQEELLLVGNKSYANSGIRSAENVIAQNLNSMLTTARMEQRYSDSNFSDTRNLVERAEGATNINELRRLVSSRYREDQGPDTSLLSPRDHQGFAKAYADAGFDGRAFTNSSIQELLETGYLTRSELLEYVLDGTDARDTQQ